MTSPAPPPIGSALSALARVTLTRTFRSALPWIAVVIAALPAAVVAALKGHGADEALPLVLVVLPAMFVAPALGEEIEDRTGAYLWSRPLPRWTIVAGKLLALAPLCAALVAAGAILAALAGDAALRSPVVIVAYTLGTLGACACAAGVALRLPRHAMIFSLCYLALDWIAGRFVGSLHLVTVTYATRTIAGQTESGLATGVIALAAISAVWLAFAFARIGRIET